VTRDAAGALTGLLPLFLMQSPFMGRRLVSLPFADVCVPLAVDDTATHELADQAIALAKAHRVRYLELRTGPSAVLAGRPDFAQSDIYVRWLVPLNRSLDAIWSAVRKPVQRQVKKAQKLGVQVRVAQHPDDMATYYRLHVQTRTRKHGMPVQPQHFFADLWETFAPSGTLRVLLAEHEGTVIAGMVLFASGTIVRYAYGASDARFLHLAPNNLLMWEAIAWASRQGYRTLDMGRTARDNGGLMEFKRGWGAVQEPLPYYYYPRVAGLAATTERSWKYHLLTTCWKRLPLALAESMGSRLYRHLG
jgi:CelD/BcsL family acetyltransferase involved in cellulose biosynthesis